MYVQSRRFIQSTDSLDGGLTRLLERRCMSWGGFPLSFWIRLHASFFRLGVPINNLNEAKVFITRWKRLIRSRCMEEPIQVRSQEHASSPCLST